MSKRDLYRAFLRRHDAAEHFIRTWITGLSLSLRHVAHQLGISPRMAVKVSSRLAEMGVVFPQRRRN